MKKIITVLMTLVFVSCGMSSPIIIKNNKSYYDANYSSYHDTLIIKKGTSWNQMDFKYPILIYEYGVSKINSIGGVDVMFNIFNCREDKIIKYIHINIVPYNIFDEIQSCNIDNISSRNIKLTGPIIKNKWDDNHSPSLYIISRFNHGIKRYWSSLWYNHSIRKIKIMSIIVMYTDETFICYSEKEIEDIIVEGKKPYIRRND